MNIVVRYPLWLCHDFAVKQLWHDINVYCLSVRVVVVEGRVVEREFALHHLLFVGIPPVYLALVWTGYPSCAEHTLWGYHICS